MSFRSAAKPVSGLSALAPNYDVILCDAWGVVHDGRRRTASACEALMRFRARGGTVVLITNAPRPREPIQKLLDGFSVPREAYDTIVSSGDVTVDLVAARGMAPLHHIGPPKDLSLFETVAAVTGEKPPLLSLAEADYVVCTGLFDDYEDPEPYLPTLVAMKERDLPMICANPDLVVERGEKLIPCAGAMAALYDALGGETRIAGKPHRPIYEAALDHAAALRGTLDRARVVAIGDGMPTDVLGALAQGLDLLYISGGIHARDYMTGGRTDEQALARFLAGHEANPRWWMPRLA